MIATSSPPDPAIRIVGLRKRFGDRIALDDVSFDVATGEVVAILGASGASGASGAGKTTLFRCITRLAQSDSGQIFFQSMPSGPSAVASCRWRAARLV
jgi:ABC-type glutathione transport system ATPase component